MNYLETKDGYKLEVIIEKSGSEWKVSSKKFYALIAKGKIKKIAIENAKNILKEKTQEDIQKAFARIRKKTVENRFFVKMQNYFKSIFGFFAPVCRYSLITNSRRIDPVRFDVLIHTPDGQSTYDFVLAKYGEKALNLIKHLI